MKQEIGRIVAQSRSAFNARKTLDLDFRREQIRQVMKMLTENEKTILDALDLDLKKPSFETKLVEIEYVKNDCRGMLFNLDEYTAPQPVPKNLVLMMDTALVRAEPLGLILIIGTWNYPVMVTLSPLVGAIAAGNVAIIKPSEVTPHTANVLGKLIPEYLDPDCFHVINGGAEVTQNLLEHRFDHVFYTGSREVGRSIYTQASKHLTPVTLELGGKSPVFIDDDVSNVEVAWRRILWGKIVNAGQTCVAPDYVLCSEQMKQKLIGLTPKIMKRFFPDENPKKSKDFARIVSRKHFDRINKMLTTSSGHVICGGETDADELYIAPTVLVDVAWDDSTMQEEIFGPILPVLKVMNAVEAIDLINQGPSPLSLYVFTDRKDIINKFINETSSGSFCANDVVVHLSADALPFGGVRDSGFGCYHGKHTFDLFSHKKAILIRDYNPLVEWVSSKRYPPYSDNHLRRLLRLLKKRNIPFPKQWRSILFFLLGVLSVHLYQSYIKF